MSVSLAPRRALLKQPVHEYGRSTPILSLYCIQQDRKEYQTRLELSRSFYSVPTSLTPEHFSELFPTYSLNAPAITSSSWLKGLSRFPLSGAAS